MWDSKLTKNTQKIPLISALGMTPNSVAQDTVCRALSQSFRTRRRRRSTLRVLHPSDDFDTIPAPYASPVDRRAGEQPAQRRPQIRLKPPRDLRLRQADMKRMRRARISTVPQSQHHACPAASPSPSPSVLDSHVQRRGHPGGPQLLRVEQPVVAERVQAAHLHERGREACEGRLQERGQLGVCRRALEQFCRGARALSGIVRGTD